jgi:hypothetical protein
MVKMVHGAKEVENHCFGESGIMKLIHDLDHVRDTGFKNCLKCPI